MTPSENLEYFEVYFFIIMGCGGKLSSSSNIYKPTSIYSTSISSSAWFSYFLTSTYSCFSFSISMLDLGLSWECALVLTPGTEISRPFSAVSAEFLLVFLFASRDFVPSSSLPFSLFTESLLQNELFSSLSSLFSENDFLTLYLVGVNKFFSYSLHDDLLSFFALFL